MNCGKDSNCVHWSYAVWIGTSTSMSLRMLGMCVLPVTNSLCRLDQLAYRTVPPLEELVRIEHVVTRDRRRHVAAVALHDGHAVLAADRAREAHHEGVALRRDPAHAAALE